MDLIRRDDKHEQYVAKGYCPEIHTSRAWCAQPIGHGEDHYAIHLRPDGLIQVGIRWD